MRKVPGSQRDWRRLAASAPFAYAGQPAMLQTAARQQLVAAAPHAQRRLLSGGSASLDAIRAN